MNRRNILKFVGLSALAGAVSEPLVSENASLADAASAPDRVAFNQVGFMPGGEKIATVQTQPGADASFQIAPDLASEQNSHPVFHGTLSAPVLVSNANTVPPPYVPPIFVVPYNVPLTSIKPALGSWPSAQFA